MEPNVKVSCAHCGIEFEKKAKEYRRRIKNGKAEFFCARSCASQSSNRNHPPGNPQYLIADNRKDQYTSFRWFVLRAQYRSKRKKKYPCNMTIEYLKKMWDDQNGICPFTGWNMILPQNTAKAWETNNPANASLDRIDNTKGYIEGNVRFICVMANLGRQSFSDDQLIYFCKTVARKNEY